MAFSSAFAPARNEDATMHGMMRMLFANLFGMFTHYTLYMSERVFKWGQLLANPIGREFVAIFIRWPIYTEERPSREDAELLRQRDLINN